MHSATHIPPLHPPAHPPTALSSTQPHILTRHSSRITLLPPIPPIPTHSHHSTHSILTHLSFPSLTHSHYSTHTILHPPLLPLPFASIHLRTLPFVTLSPTLADVLYCSYSTSSYSMPLHTTLLLSLALFFTPCYSFYSVLSLFLLSLSSPSRHATPSNSTLPCILRSSPFIASS